MDSAHCKRIPQLAKIRFSLIFFALLDSTNKYLKDCTAQNKAVAEPANCYCIPQIVSRNRILFADSVYKYVLM